MKTQKLILLGACVTMVTASPLYAEDEEDSSESLPVAKAAEAQESFFRTLPLCRLKDGASEVCLPGQSAWTPLEEGRFYPLGSVYRTTEPTAKLVIEFGKECAVFIEGVASFGTRLQGLWGKTRSISLVSGKLTLKLPRNIPEKSFSVAAPGFTVTSAAGESTYRYEKTGDGDEAVVRCVTGSLSIQGRHFTIPSMRAANEVKIRTSEDVLFTGLYGTSGDYEVLLDQGMAKTKDVETGESRVEAKTLSWKLSPRTAVCIHRARPAIGERLSVTTLTFEPSGKMVNRIAFTEGRYEINTGEQGELALKRIEEQSKKAAAAAELSGGSPTTVEEPTEENASESEE